MEQQVNREHYDSINGLRSYAAIGIVLMHVKANGAFDIGSNVISHILSLFTCFVFLFMTISAFSMLCGYFDRFMGKTISIEKFYLRRYKKIWPFFAFLVIIDVLLNFSGSSLIEGFADLTLVYSLLPNPNLSIIGIGWTLGVIFVFYMLFPFFVYLMANRRRAWLAFIVSIVWNAACEIYFFDSLHVVPSYGPRNNILYCSQFFVVGGILFLNRRWLSEFVRTHRLASLTLVLALTCTYYFIDGIGSGGWIEVIKNFSMMILFAVWLIYAIGSNGFLLNNRFTRFISSISMEIYLCHMVIFRVLQKIGLVEHFSGPVGYLLTFVVVFGGAVALSFGFQKVETLLRLTSNTRWAKNENKEGKS